MTDRWLQSCLLTMSLVMCVCVCVFCRWQIDDYSLVRFLPLDITDEDSINDVLLQVDLTLQYGDDLEPKEPKVRAFHYCRAVCVDVGIHGDSNTLSLILLHLSLLLSPTLLHNRAESVIPCPCQLAQLIVLCQIAELGTCRSTTITVRWCRHETNVFMVSNWWRVALYHQ